MEEKLPDDGLEDFMKKSFEGYTESPSGDLWDKIEAGLEPVAPKPLRVRRWWLMAAAAVALGIFTCQHFYYKNELSKLSKEVELHATELHELQAKKPEDLANAPNETAPRTIADEKNENENSNIQTEESLAKIQSPRASSRSEKTVQHDLAGKGNLIKPFTTPGNFKNKDQEGQVRQAASNIPLKKELLPVETGMSKITLPGLPNENLAETSLTKVSLPNKVDLPFLKPLKTQQPVVDLLSITSSPNLILPPNTESGKRKISAGIHAMPMATRGKINALKPPHSGGPKVFNDETKTNGNTFIAGATLECGLGNNWSFGTGLNYRKTTYASTHQPSFRFDEGHHGHGGPPHQEHDFQYNLNTPTGVVELTVRVEQVDISQQIPDEEKIDLEIKTRQSLEYVSIPLGLQYRIGKGRVGLNLKGGIVANFLVNHNFGISKIESFNTRFKHQPGGMKPGGKQKNLNTISIDYMAGAGVDFALSKSWRISLGPTLIGSLTSQHNDRHIQSSSYSAGLNGALTYSF